MRDEARAKGWNTWRKNMYMYAEQHPEYSLDEFIVQRYDTSYDCWRKAREAERNRDWRKARNFYWKSVEGLEQVVQLGNATPPLVDSFYMLKSEYFNFAVTRDPLYRLFLKHPLKWIKEEPGMLQTELYKRTQLNREDGAYMLYFAEKEGLIRREKKGRSYQLFFEKEKSDMDIFQKIQDDDIDRQIQAEKDANFKSGCRLITDFFLFIVGISCIPVMGPFALIPIFLIVLYFILRKKRDKKAMWKAKKTTTELPQITDKAP